MTCIPRFKATSFSRERVRPLFLAVSICLAVLVVPVNPGKGVTVAANPAARDDAYAKLKEFLRKHLGP